MLARRLSVGVIAVTVGLAGCGSGGSGSSTSTGSGGSCAPTPCAAASGVTISVVNAHADTANSAYDLQLQVNNQSSGTYTLVAGTDLVLVGSGGASLDLAVSEATGSNCYASLSDPDYSVTAGQTLLLPRAFCFQVPSSFGQASQLQVQGNTPDTYTIKLS